MGQIEIYELLKKHPNRKFESKEISSNLKINTSAITQALKKLVKWKLIQVLKVPKSKTNNKKIYLYYYEK